MTQSSVYVWDLPLRVFHWALVLGVSAAYLTGQRGGLWIDWHLQAGLWVVALLVFRLAWGLLGSHTARFANFLPTPARVRRYYCAPQHFIGHSPPAALAVFALLAVLLVQVTTGLFAVEEDLGVSGPLAALVDAGSRTASSGWHRATVNLLLALVTLHVFANLFYSLFTHRGRVLAMFTGRQPVSAMLPQRAAPRVPAWRLVVALALAAAAYLALAGAATAAAQAV